MSDGLQRLFSEVTGTYELVNHLLTWGLDRGWRRRAVRLAAAGGGTHWLDICTGTGETAAGLSHSAADDTTVMAADFCLPMLATASKKPEAARIGLVGANAASLPFPDASLDTVTISFASRNLNAHPAFFLSCLREFHRVLRPGGRFIQLETSQPPNRLVRGLLHLYVKLSVKPLGALISGSRPAYAYLAHTIPRFHTAEGLAAILREAGFRRVEIHPLTLGAVAIHEAFK